MQNQKILRKIKKFFVIKKKKFFFLSSFSFLFPSFFPCFLSFFSCLSFLSFNVSSQTHRLARIDRICPPYPPLVKGEVKIQLQCTLYIAGLLNLLLGEIFHELTSSKDRFKPKKNPV